MVSAAEKNVEEKSTLMWIMLYGVCGAQAAAMDAQIIRDEEGISLLPRTQRPTFNLLAQLQYS